MRDFGRIIIMGSARVSRAWRARPAIADLFRRFNFFRRFKFDEKIVSARRRNQARETRALPRGLLSRGLIAFTMILSAGAVAIWCLPLPANLRVPAIGTLNLLDCRGREIAQIAS